MSAEGRKFQESQKWPLGQAIVWSKHGAKRIAAEIRFSSGATYVTLSLKGE
jgi:hypothetical protein